MSKKYLEEKKQNQKLVGKKNYHKNNLGTVTFGIFQFWPNS